MYEALGYIQNKEDGQVKPYFDIDENGYCVSLPPNNTTLGQWASGKMWEEVEPPIALGCKKEESYLTPQNEFEKAVINTCTNLAETLIKKNRDYGDSFRLIYDEYGDFSTEIRLTDKLNRLKTLNKQDNLVKDESKDDTLLDIAGYSVLTLATKRIK